MTHRQKVDRLMNELGKKGVGKYTVAPPIFRLLWTLGLQVPPPFFLGFFALTLLMGAFFGVFWGGTMWLLQRQSGRLPVELAVIIAAGAGLCFGLAMATYYRWKAARLGLPTWESYGEQSNECV